MGLKLFVQDKVGRRKGTSKITHKKKNNNHITYILYECNYNITCFEHFLCLIESKTANSDHNSSSLGI